MATIRVEAENTALNNYTQQNTFIRLLGTEGTASFDFTGDAGIYNVVIGYYDENDGQAQLSVSKGNDVLDEWTLDQDLEGKRPNANTFLTRSVATGLNLAAGDSFSITGTLDKGELAAIDYIEFIPVENNSAPTTTGIADISVAQNAPNSVVDLWVAFEDAEDADNALTYSVENNSNAALFDDVSIDAATGELTFDYNATASGIGEITVRATDTGGAFVDTSFNVNVNAIPTTTGIADVSVAQNAPNSVVDLWAAFEDAEDADNALTYSVENNSNEALFDDVSIDPATGELTLDYDAIATGSSEITVKATDTGGAFVNTTFNVNVNNSAPTTTGIADVSVAQNAPNSVVDLWAAFEDAEDADNALTYSVENNSNEALFDDVSIDAATGELTFDYNAIASGSSEITVKATDTGGAFVNTTFNVNVNNSAPTTTGIADVSVAQNAPNSVVDLWAAFEDAEDADNALTYSVENNSNEALFDDVSIDAATGELTFDYNAIASGSSEITVKATDTGGAFVNTTFNVNVNNSAPTTTGIADVSVAQNAPNSVVDLWAAFEDAEDADNALTYSVENNSNEALFDDVSIDAATGELTLDYNAIATGSSEITVKATDTGGAFVNTTFNVNVSNSAPITTGIADFAVPKNSVDTVIPLWDIFEDAENTDNQLTFSIDNSNLNLLDATINPTTGELTLDYSGKETGTANLTVTATDTGGLSTPTSFTVDVFGSLRIEAEDYREGGQDVAYNDLFPANDPEINQGGEYRPEEGVDIESTDDVGGGFNVGWVVPGEWLTYDITVPQTGVYDIVARVASNENQTHQLQYSLDEQQGTFEFDGTGDWQNWENVTLSDVSLNAGSNILRLDILDGNFNLNYIEFIPVGDLAPNTAPVITEIINDITVNAGADNTEINLFDVFEDQESFDDELNYEISSNSNPGLIGTNIVNGQLTLAYPAASGGTAEITVTATDPEGLSTETTFSVDVIGPVRIEAEDYQQGGQGVAYNDLFPEDNPEINQGGEYRPDEGVDIESTDDVGGGFNVGWVLPGEWMKYDVTVPKTGTYNIVARVASNVEDNHQLQYSLNGQQGTFEFDGTGGWQDWIDVTLSDVSLTEGDTELRLDIIGGNFNLNYIELIPVDIPDDTVADPVSYAAASQGVYVDLWQELGFVPDSPMNEPLTIMALGDSITEGVDGVTPKAERGGYRTYLWQALDGLGLEVDFVGTKQNGPAELGDRDNLGFPGWSLGNLRLGRTTDEFTEETTGVDDWLTQPQLQADAILLMGGTNNASGSTDNSSSMLNQLELLLDDIEALTTAQSYNGGEGAEVFLATIPPIDPARQGAQRPISAQNYNQLIRDEIPSNYDVTVVDVESALTVNDLAGSGDNGLHPSDQGYQKIANEWLEEILDNYGTQDDLEGVTEVTGSSLDDVITGSSANNQIEGGAGDDELTGAGGADTFVYSNPSAGVDTITDFNPAEGDLFEISASGFGGGLTPGALAANQFVVGTTAADADDRFVYDDTTGNLFFDVDGNGNTASTLLAILDGNPVISEAQFSIV